MPVDSDVWEWEIRAVITEAALTLYISPPACHGKRQHYLMTEKPGFRTCLD